MGSESLDTNFVEMDNSSHWNISSMKSRQYVPHYEHWKNSFPELLDDAEGYKLFYEFLEKEQLVVLFDCWYCCRQYRKYTPSRAAAKDVYTRFVKIKDSRVPISDQARNNLALRLRANNITEILLEEVEKEVYGNLRDICYPKFLKSNFFNLYCETAGHVGYTSNECHSKYEKPSHCAGVLNSVKEYEPLATHGRPSNYGYNQHEYTFNDRGAYLPASKTGNDDGRNLSLDYECDKASMADSKHSLESSGRPSRPSRNHHDSLDVANFKPRTQRISQQSLKQMEPKDFAALLIEKLEVVVRERDREAKHDSVNLTSMKHSLPASYSCPPQYSHENEFSECDAQSWVMSDRPSVAGQSSHSGSHSGILVNKKAKELRDIVHHQLRSDLKECKCENCLQVKYHERCCHAGSTHSSGVRGEHQQHYYVNSRQHSQHGYYPQSSHSNSYQQSNHTVEETNKYNTISSAHHRDSRPHHHHDPYELQNIAPPVDNSKIYSWMQKNEKYQKEAFANPAPSPSLRRKKKNNALQYNTSRSAAKGVQPIAQDTGMPLLPQPDAENVLQEVKRVLEEPQQQQQSRTSRQTNQYHPPPRTPHDEYSPEMYDKHSMVSTPWSMSDGASIVSYNPSQISTVPSSASRLWNAQGYFDNGSEVRDERCTPSEVHSSASRHSGGPRNLSRGEHMGGPRSMNQNDMRSDVRSQSTNRSYGSDGSRGRSSKNKTVVTYYIGGEPIPYRITIPSTEVTLGQFKAEFKRGNYRFFFKTVSSVDGETVYEEVRNDDEILPMFNNRIVGKVDKI